MNIHRATSFITIRPEQGGGKYDTKVMIYNKAFENVNVSEPWIISDELEV